ncbi:ABC transporter permease [Furfurilactobacillus sp. WILCCON 0119]
MRVSQIIKRILTELVRDKRTLALVFLAPILVMWLMSVVFNTNSDTNVTIGVVNVNTTITRELKDVNHVSVKHYDSETAARHALTKQHVDAFIKQKDDRFDVTYANTDSGKTAATKMGLQSSITKMTITKLATTVTTLAKANQQLMARSGGVATGEQAAQTAIPTNGAVTIHNHYAYGNADTNFFNKLMPILMAFFVFLFVFLVSGMGLLKERTTGTLDRVLSTPVKRTEIVLGYLGSYGILAFFQTIIIVLVTVWLLKVEIVGNIINLIIINMLVAFVALAAGILLSTLASSEFQMIQFIPIVVVPQIFLSGLVPLDSLPKWLDAISYVLPLRYAADAQEGIIFHGENLINLWGDVAVLIIFTIVLGYLNVVGLRRYRKV